MKLKSFVKETRREHYFCMIIQNYLKKSVTHENFQ